MKKQYIVGALLIGVLNLSGLLTELLRAYDSILYGVFNIPTIEVIDKGNDLIYYLESMGL